MTATAKLFLTGRSQAVRLPKAFRMPGTQVRVSRDGDKVILEPMKPPFDFEAWHAELLAITGGEFLPEGRPEQPPMRRLVVMPRTPSA